MTTKGSKPKPAKRGAAAAQGVEAFLAALEHPLKPEILALRQAVLGADPGIAEGVKWNAPSFRTSEYFATMNLRAKNGVGIILHFGAKRNRISETGVAIADPESLLEWLAKDRASVTFRDLKDIHAKQAAFANVIRQWIQHVEA